MGLCMQKTNVLLVMLFVTSFASFCSDSDSAGSKDNLGWRLWAGLKTGTERGFTVAGLEQVGKFAVRAGSNSVKLGEYQGKASAMLLLGKANDRVGDDLEYIGEGIEAAKEVGIGAAWGLAAGFSADSIEDAERMAKRATNWSAVAGVAGWMVSVCLGGEQKNYAVASRICRVLAGAAGLYWGSPTKKKALDNSVTSNNPALL